jgi:hypothetical protein
MLKKISSIIMVLTLVSIFTITSAEAGSRQQGFLTGAGIALGAMALGGMMAHQLYASPLPPPAVYSPPPPRVQYVPGHWEVSRDWVSGNRERIWIPDYRDRRGNWIAGHYEDRQTPGHYEERRIWIEGYYRND